ncbi:MAG: (d)CMP kinase [Acidobacteria bacterium]|nr:(d)CMP kinase [Acidobacteriota bacterium]
MVIAIDGPSGAGKSTVARGVAERLGYLYVDSGAMYRAVAWAAGEQGIPCDDAERVAGLTAGLRIDLEKAPNGVRVLANGRDVTAAIRAPEVSHGASVVATHAAVREQLVAQQRRIGAAGGIVMEGRDIGSVVFPGAELKIFLDASVEERARRRYLQQREMGVESALERTRKEVEERDHRDATREVSPLVRAADAVYLDTTALTADEVVQVIVRLAEKKVEESKSGRV